MLPRYLIYRHGSNAANQSMCQKMPVDIVHATSKREAIELAAGRVSVYANQHLTAVPESKVKHGDWNAVLESEPIP